MDKNTLKVLVDTAFAFAESKTANPVYLKLMEMGRLFIDNVLLESLAGKLQSEGFKLTKS